MSYGKRESRSSHTRPGAPQYNKKAENRKRRRLEKQDPEKAPKKMPRQGWTD